MAKSKVIQQGAEAVLIKRGKDLLKRRVKKSYRLAELDNKIRKRRTRKEGKLLAKAGKLIPVPEVKSTDESSCEITMGFLAGKKLSEHLDDMKNWKGVCEEIGVNIAKLHDADIIHGDLTTSNMIWVGKKLDSTSLISKTRSARELSQKSSRGDDNVGFGKSGKLFFIDFGLGFDNGRVEDKAVDLHLIKQALEAKHFLYWEKFWKAIVKGYRKGKGFEAVMKRFEKVELRGRYKQQF